MANEAQVAILEQGVAVWNQWRQENHTVTPDLSYANLREANFTDVQIGWTILGNVDLSKVKGLESISHQGPSSIGIDTIYKRKELKNVI